MPKVTAVTGLLLLLSPAYGANWGSSDELRRRSADAEGKAFRPKADRVSGNVEVCGKGACREVFDGRPLREGDVLKTGVGARCDVLVQGAGRLRVLENTELRIGGAAGGCGFRVARGAVLAALETSDCRVESPQASASTRDSRFRLDYAEGGVARFVVSDSAAKLLARVKPRSLLGRWWAGKAPINARVPEDAAGALARLSGDTMRAGLPIEEGGAIALGDEVETASGGWASIALSDGFAVVLDQKSRVAFEERDGRAALTLLKGRLYVARLRPGPGLPPLITAGSSKALEGSDEFEVSVDENSGLADFAVYLGELAVRAGQVGVSTMP